MEDHLDWASSDSPDMTADESLLGQSNDIITSPNSSTPSDSTPHKMSASETLTAGLQQESVIKGDSEKETKSNLSLPQAQPLDSHSKPNESLSESSNLTPPPRKNSRVKTNTIPIPSSSPSPSDSGNQSTDLLTVPTFSAFEEEPEEEEDDSTPPMKPLSAPKLTSKKEENDLDSQSSNQQQKAPKTTLKPSELVTSGEKMAGVETAGNQSSNKTAVGSQISRDPNKSVTEVKSLEDAFLIFEQWKLAYPKTALEQYFVFKNQQISHLTLMSCANELTKEMGEETLEARDKRCDWFLSGALPEASASNAKQVEDHDTMIIRKILSDLACSSDKIRRQADEAITSSLKFQTGVNNSINKVSDTISDLQKAASHLITSIDKKPLDVPVVKSEQSSSMSDTVKFKFILTVNQRGGHNISASKVKRALSKYPKLADFRKIFKHLPIYI